MSNRITHVTKRSGKIVLFNEDKIVQAVWKAMSAVDEGTRAEAEAVRDHVVRLLNEKFPNRTPSVEDVQDAVEEALIELQHAKVAKAYILYRSERAKLREQKAALIGGRIDDLKLSFNSLKILERRYLLRDSDGLILETPTELFWRVANTVAMAEIKHGKEPRTVAKEYFELMSTLQFLPGSPILMNAGTKRQLSSCFVFPINDNVESIFAALSDGAIAQKMGGGVGYSFSRLRARNEHVAGMAGVASGPIGFMRVFEQAMRTVKQSGRRQGGNMAVLRVDHPDILDFINLKLDGRTMTNFNTSVAITDAFMHALIEDRDYELKNPQTGESAGILSARVVFDSILAVSWRCGDPGILFIDRINETNACPHLGHIECTSACGEMPLLPYESCNEGSINLALCVRPGKREVDWEKLRNIAGMAVTFLDNVIDVNNYPIPNVERVAKGTRKIGLGVMGFADLLYQLRIRYDSDEAVQVAERIAATIAEGAAAMSEKLARERGLFPAWKGSEHEKNGHRRRNSTLMAIAPTGSISLIADVSAGIEPNYALAYTRTVVDGGDMLCINPYFEQALEDADVPKEIIARIATRGIIDSESGIPDELREVFVTAQQIQPEWHIRIQAAFQSHVDGAISKTINFPARASVGDIEQGLLLAWQLGCKGLTVYRDSSLDTQVLNAGSG